MDCKIIGDTKAEWYYFDAPSGQNSVLSLHAAKQGHFDGGAEAVRCRRALKQDELMDVLPCPTLSRSYATIALVWECGADPNAQLSTHGVVCLHERISTKYTTFA
jgi:hypothetical protein